jgi:hypothetical protein
MQDLVLRYRWPLLKIIDLKKIGGLFTKNGEDLLIFTLLHSHFNKNPGSHLLEIDKPSQFPFSISTALIKNVQCSATLVNTNRGVSVHVDNTLPTSPNNVTAHSYDLELLGCGALGDRRLELKQYETSREIALDLRKFETNSLHIITSMADSSISLLDYLLSNYKVCSVMLLCNNQGYFSLGNDLIREKLLKFGLIYYSRLNGETDLFIASEMINGFPSDFITKFGLNRLARVIGTPPGSDYSRPC